MEIGGKAAGGNAMRKLAVIGQQQQSLSLGVQAPHVHEPDGFGMLELVGVLGHPPGSQFGNSGTALRILHGGHHTGRFVQHDSDDIGIGQHAGIVDPDLLRRRIDPYSGLGDDHAIHTDPSRRDEHFACAPGGDSGMGQDLLEALTADHVRIIASAASGAAPSGETFSLLLLAQGLSVESGQLGGGGGILVQLFEVILVVELLAGQVDYVAAH